MTHTSTRTVAHATTATTARTAPNDPPCSPTTALPRLRTALSLDILALLACLACKPAAPPSAPTATPTPTAAPRPTPAGLRGPVVSIDLLGTTREVDARSALTTTIGAAYDPAAVSRDVHALWDLRGISDVQVDARPAPGGVALRYRLTELPQVRKVEVEGGPALYLTAWRTRTAELVGAAQDAAAIRRLAEDLRLELVSNAFPDTRVDWRILPADGGVDVVFTVVEGPKLTLAALTFRGNRKLRAAELESIFRTRGVAVGQPFTAVARDAAQLAVLSRYQDLGHVHAEFSKTTAETRSADGKTISATYEIREGDAYSLGKLKIRGALLAPVRDYEQLLGVRPGQPFNRTRVAQGIEKIRTFHRERGAGEPSVLADTAIDSKTKKITLTLEISKP